MDELHELAKVYAASYASPHHITFTLDGLKSLVAALSQPAAAQDGGWIGWGGGDCPVAPGVMVEVRLRNAALSSYEPRSAEFWDWESTEDDCNIVAYRVTKATP